jgi:hypothetical protein
MGNGGATITTITTTKIIYLIIFPPRVSMDDWNG